MNDKISQDVKFILVIMFFIGSLMVSGTIEVQDKQLEVHYENN